MLDLDILLPSFSRINFLNQFSFPFIYRMNNHWFPLFLFQDDFKKMGINIHFINKYHLKKNTFSEIVCIDCKVFSPYTKNNLITKSFQISFLKHLKKKTKSIIWFDTTDSTGTTQFEVLPYVNKYLKKQILKDRTFYTRNSYTKETRKYIYFYIKNYDINYKQHNLHNNVKLLLKYNHKIDISWNFALSDYRSSNLFLRFINLFSNKMNLNYVKPNKNRKYDFSANFGLKYSPTIISFQRYKLIKFLLENYKEKANVSIGRVSKKKYVYNLSNSKAIFSPFGYGELCLRDFEAYINGAALIKPDVEHLETWPKVLIKNRTYISIPWEIERWDQLIPDILHNNEKLKKVAKSGQDLYKTIWTRENEKIFCKRFIEMINPI